MTSTDLFDALLHALTGTPICSTPFHTPNGALCATSSVSKQYKCRHQFDYTREQPLVLLDCITTPPATWRYDFVHTFVVAEDDLPPNLGRLSVDWEQYIQDGGATANQGGWWVHKPPGRIALVGSGTCGPFCNIAKSVAMYLAEHFGRALDQLAVVDVGAGVGSFAACLSSMHGVGTIVSVSPWEPGQNEHGGQEAGQTFLATQRGVPLLIDYASSDRQLPLQAGSVHAVFSCYGAGGTLKGHHWFWYEVSRLLKPGGFLILEGHIRSHASNPVPKNITQFCMAPAPAPVAYENRWFNGQWLRYRGQLRAYRRLSVQECDLDATRVCRHVPRPAHPEKVKECIHVAPARPKRFSHTAAARAAWHQLLEAMEPWMHLPPSEIHRLKEDDEKWTLQPPANTSREHLLRVALDVVPVPPANASRAVTVLVINATDAAFVQALRERAPAYWGVGPASIRPMWTTPHMHAANSLDGALVHSPCLQSFPFHPHAFDIVLVPNALAQAEHCEREWTTHAVRMASTRPKHEPRVSGWWHLMLELLRVLRPGPLGLLVLTGDASFELHLQEGLQSLHRAAAGRTPSPSGTRRPLAEAAVDSSAGVLGALNVSILGCVTRGPFCACVLRSMGMVAHMPPRSV